MSIGYWRAPCAQLWLATDIRQAVRGQEWVVAVALGCLALTTAIASVLYAGVASLSGALRSELGAERGEVIMVAPTGGGGPCRLDERNCAAQVDAGMRAMAELRRMQPVALRYADIATVSRGTVTARLREHSVRAELIGADGALFRLQPLTINTGRAWTVGEEAGGRPVALVGKSLFDSLENARAHGYLAEAERHPRVTTRLRVGRVELEVIGIVESGAAAAVQVDHAVIVPRALFARLRPMGETAPALFARTPTAPDGASLLEALHSLERRLPRFAGQLTVSTSQDQLGDVALLEQSLTHGVTGLSLVLTLSALVAVGALMVTIARAHRRAVGIARALGATRGLIVAQGALLGVLTAAVGVACGGALAVAGMLLMPMLLEVPPLPLLDMSGALVRGAVPPLLTATVTGTMAFTRLALLRPARLLA